MSRRVEANRKSNYRDGRGIFWGGVVAGIIAGIVMAIFAMGYAAVTGMGMLAPLRMIGATVYGVDAMIGGAGVLMAGAVIHMTASAVFGVILAAILPARSSGGAAFGFGLIYGVAVWAVMTWGVLPGLNPTMSARVALMPGAWLFEHLVFGGVLAITPGLVRSLSRRPAEIEERRERPAA